VLDARSREEVAVLAPGRHRSRLEELLRVRYRQGAQDDGVDQRKHSRRAAHAEPERKDRDRRESGAPLHQPRAVAQIGKELCDDSHSVSSVSIENTATDKHR
jgi:hypothetical protein